MLRQVQGDWIAGDVKAKVLSPKEKLKWIRNNEWRCLLEVRAVSFISMGGIQFMIQDTSRLWILQRWLIDGVGGFRSFLFSIGRNDIMTIYEHFEHTGFRDRMQCVNVMLLCDLTPYSRFVV
jgi:hypothetical protein